MENKINKQNEVVKTIYNLGDIVGYSQTCGEWKITEIKKNAENDYYYIIENSYNGFSMSAKENEIKEFKILPNGTNVKTKDGIIGKVIHHYDTNDARYNMGDNLYEKYGDNKSSTVYIVLIEKEDKKYCTTEHIHGNLLVEVPQIKIGTSLKAIVDVEVTRCKDDKYECTTPLYFFEVKEEDIIAIGDVEVKEIRRK